MKHVRRIGFGAVVSIIVALSVSGTTTATAQEASSLSETEVVLHQELRDLRARLDQALRDRNRDAVLAEFTADFYFTAMNNEIISGQEAGRAYFDRMLAGEDSFIEEMRATLVPDDLSTLYLDGKVAVSTGISDAYFKATNGIDVDLPLRWTATLVRKEGAWKVAAVHFSTDVFNNPLSRNLSRYVIGGGIVVALLFGSTGYLLGRRRSLGVG